MLANASQSSSDLRLHKPFLSKLRLIAIGLFGLSLSACLPQDDQGKAAAPPSAPPVVSVAKPVIKTIVEWDEYTARLEAVESVDIRARVSGYLEKISFKEGSLVQKGDLLFNIDPRPFQAELRRLEAELALAKANEENSLTQFKRAERLLASNSISDEEHQLRRTSNLAARADVQRAKAAVEAARLNLEFTNVRSPISGRISRPFVTQGNLVQGSSGEATILTKVVSIDPIHAYFEASERAYLKYVRLSRSGERPSSRDVRNPVYLRLSDEDNFDHRGYIDFVDNLLDENTGTMTGRAILANPDRVLTPGLFARVRLPGSGAYDAVLIPDAAIGSDQTVKYVYVVAEDNSVSYRRIKTGPIVHGLRVVREGLKADERIVISGIQRVQPDATVSPEPGTIDVQDEPLGPEDAAPANVALR